MSIDRPITESHINGYSLTKRYKVKRTAGQDKTLGNSIKQREAHE